jgi:DNA sulfur modification protein DndB
MVVDVAQDFLSNLNVERTMSVPALRGRLGGVDYFVITLNYSELPRYVAPTDPNITDPRLRENRRPKKSRYADIATYMVQNPDNYRFSALTCTYGKNGTERPIDWRPATPTGPGSTIGTLTLVQSDPLVIVDGQHRLGAIEAAIDQDPSLRDESIPIVLFPYISVEHAQQLFSDLNRNAKKTTKSLDILFDHRDGVNQVVQSLIGRVSFFGDRVNMEDVSVPTNSSQVFTLAGIYQATKPVLEAKAATGDLPKLDAGSVAQYVDELTDYWEYLGGFFPEWGKVARGELDIRQVRNQFLHWNSGVLSALGEFAGFLIRHHGDDWTTLFEKAVDHPTNQSWSRNSDHWRGIATAGTMVLPRSALRAQLLAYLKNLAGITLTPDESRVLAHAQSRG